MRSGKPQLKKTAPQNARIAFVVSAFNAEITEGLLQGALHTLSDAGFPRSALEIFRVPGSFELPLAAKKLAKRNVYDGIIAIGAVIKGDTDHYYHVAEGATMGLMHVMLETEVPIAFCVLTTKNQKQAKDRAGGTDNKGSEAAEALLSMLAFHQNLLPRSS